jgi:subtilisin family serine protease
MRIRLLTACSILTVALVLTLSWDNAYGGMLSTELEDRLEAADSLEFVSVLLFLSDQVLATDLTAAFKARSFTRQATHKLAIEKLQQHAEYSQQGVRALLAEGAFSGEVVYFESYWIANAIRVDAIPTFIKSLSSRSDVEIIIENLPPEALWAPRPDDATELITATAGQGLSAGLVAIGADLLWQDEITGEGTLVGSMDSGVDGMHPGLSESYRGNNGYSAHESWYDPVYHEDYPHYESEVGASYRHGTNTLGIMVGKDDNSGDTVGVAFGAQWIAAMVVDVPGANYLQAFQWFADPDGDPNTIDDVPDVLSNSWGFRQENLGCLDVFWTAIDNLEALGTVVVFACGNEGDSPYSLRNPANRATTPYNTFSVGALSPTDSIWRNSSRGPSDCDSISIKPEVTAPGQDVRTTEINGGYTSRTGTSFAAPHVAGAVALLRQINPNASVDTIKWALMTSATDLGEAGEDNTYGHGLINLPAARDLLPENLGINIYLSAVQPDSVQPDTTVDVVVELKNSGEGTVDVWGRIINADPRITILQDSASFGNLGMNEVGDNGSTPFVLHFAGDIPEGLMLDVDLQIGAGGGGYLKNVKMYFLIGAPLVRSAFTHVGDSLRFTVSNYATYGLAVGSAATDGGIGFRYPASDSNSLYECGLLVARDSNQVSDGISNLHYSVDIDFQVAAEGNLHEVSPGLLGDIETISRFHDGGAPNPLGITIEQRTASCLTGSCGNYVIMEYLLTNTGDELLDDLRIGLYFDWDFPFGLYAGSRDRSGFDQAAHLGYMWHQSEADYRGTAVLSDLGMTGFYAIHNSNYIYDGVSEEEKYYFLSSAPADSTGDFNFDRSYCISTGPYNLAPGESDIAAFAIIGASSLEQLTTAAEQARDFYRAATPVVEDDAVVLPNAFGLEQNYPNPFNPATNISFSVPRAGRVTLEIFNLLGRRVITLVDQEMSAGVHQVRWEGVDSQGNAAASGLYFYRLRSADLTAVKKMLLLK